MNSSIESPFFTEVEAANFLKLKPKTLRNMRWRGAGPCYRKHGSRVIYEVNDLKSYSQKAKRQPYHVRQHNLI
jgi:hypothetical protein